ncbi:redoxin domain-containing protein [Candidatus Roizmanbacteria bacterium]|nr:redoxin domain-containing protein [Candidatus Roizmanbacteria bacterium]
MRFFQIVLLFFLAFFLAQPAISTLESCSASVSPNSVPTSTNQNFSFTLTNSGSNPILFFKVSVPSENFTLQGHTISGWNVNRSESYAIFSDGNLTSGNQLSFSLQAAIGNSEAVSSNWHVEANDVLSGNGTTNCGGSLGTAISGITDVTPPTISETITVSGVNSSSATVNWITDEETTSIVHYGLTTDYGSNASGTGLTTSHSVTLSGLTVNTTYYFYLESADSSGNATTSEELSFVTAETTTTAEVTPIVIQTTTTKTETKTETKTSTKIIEIRDTLPPTVTVSTDFEKPFEQAPEISGRAADKSRIVVVEYSIDNGENWLPVDEVLSPGQTSTEFRFVPSIFDDGNYEIKVRALDGAGNYGTSKVQTLIIDRLPPLIGASLFSLGPLILQPDKNGTIVTSTGVEQKITLSAAGGPTTIDLFINDSMSSLSKSVATGLWSGNVKFTKSGVYTIKYKAVDGGGNVTEDNLARIIVVQPGQVLNKNSQKPIKNASVRLFQKDELTQIWYPWDGSAFNQNSPQTTSDRGIYSYFLPPGQYYFKVEAQGYDGVMSQIFNVSFPTPINSVFHLTPKKFPIQFNWEKVDVVINIPETSATNSINNLIGKTTQEFSGLRGRPTLITFLNTWFPLSIEQINQLDRLKDESGERININGIAVQEKPAKIDVFSKRGGYNITFLADQDGTLAKQFSVTTLPTHLFLDRRGTIINIITGVLTEAEILSNF